MEFLIASRRARPGNDPIFALNAEAKERMAAGEDVVNATIGALLEDDGSLAVMPTVVETLAAVPPTVTAAYAPIPGRPDFRQAVIDDLLTGTSMHARAAAVATPGGSGALRMSIDDFLEPGQTVLTASYFWGPYRTLSDEAGRQLETFAMFDDAKRFNAGALDEALGKVMDQQGRALIFLNTPCHNPTGYSMDAEEWEQTRAAIRKHTSKGPITVLVDVAYGYYAPEALKAAIEAVGELSDEAMVAFAWSASKSFAEYGLRVGSLVAVPPDPSQREVLQNAMTYSCRGLWSNCNAGGQFAIAKLLSDATLKAKVSKERAAIVEMLAKRVDIWNELAGPIAALDYPRYDGGFFTTVFCDDPPAVAAACKAKGVFVVPTRGAVRVAMCSANASQIPRIVEALKAALA